MGIGRLMVGRRKSRSRLRQTRPQAINLLKVFYFFCIVQRPFAFLVVADLKSATCTIEWSLLITWA